MRIRMKRLSTDISIGEAVEDSHLGKSISIGSCYNSQLVHFRDIKLHQVSL